MEPHALLILLSTICLCALLAHRLRLVPPIAFLFGGIALALIPGMQTPHIEPEYMLILFLPPLLMEAAFFTSLRDFKNNLRPITALAFGLVILTAVATAFIFVETVPGANWALGFLLGAIISPPDAAAATSALRNAPIPRRVQSILEGESLVNDAVGIVLYKFAVAAVIAGSFSLADASVELAWKAGGAIVVGLAIAYLFILMFPYLKEPSVEILATFIPCYASYMLAESMHSSGVLAVVACGLLIGWHAPALFTARMRMPALAIWRMAVFFINALAFLLIGLQLPELMGRIWEYNTGFVVTTTIAVCVTAVVVRFVYVFGSAYLAHWLFPTYCKHHPLPAWQNIFLIGWTGMRGVVTLALALAIPLTLKDGTAFPYRDLIIFLSVAVILCTLVLQGVTLPWLTRTLTLSFDPQRMQEEWLARMAGVQRALHTLEELENSVDIHRPALERIRSHYLERLESLGDGPNTPLRAEKDSSMTEHPLVQAENRIWREVIHRERDTILHLRHNFTISDEVMHDLLRELDLTEARFQYTLRDMQVSVATPAEKQWLWRRHRRRSAAN